MEKQIKRSVLPIYMIGVTWILYAVMFSFSSKISLILCTCLSALAFTVGKMIFPDREFTLEEQQKDISSEKQTESPKQQEPKPTGNPEIDALIKERDRALSEMRRLNHNIKDEKISSQIDHLEEVTGKIIGQVVVSPKKLPQIRQFMDYYLPTTLKLLNAYDRMDSVGIAGDNIATTKEKVEKMMDTITIAYDKQLDALFREEAMDISTDITVMEQLLAREGFRSEKTEQQEKQDDGSIRLEL